jgi:hypothetical protein
MDSFDYHEEVIRPKRDISSIMLNALTGLIILMALCIGSVFLMIFINPYIGFNPFPPPTLPALASFPTATPTPRLKMPPTWTPTPTLVPTLTRTPEPTLAPTPQPVAGTPATQLPQSTGTAGDMPFVLHPGDPVAIPNIGHPEAGCNWIGVAGRAFNMSGAPIAQGLFVQLAGKLGGQDVEMLSMTGTATQYGEGGYEFTLGEKPVASQETLWVQLFDPAMLPLSDKVFFNTFSECNKNLTLVNFNQIR